jgi:hypothetical protein
LFEDWLEGAADLRYVEVTMENDARLVLENLGNMDSEAKADALEQHMAERLNETIRTEESPTAAQIEAQIETRKYRRGVGSLFIATGEFVEALPPMPEKPTLIDFFNLRWSAQRNHCLQSAAHARKTGQPEEIVFACLIHDTVQALIRADHGWWGGQLYEPYVSEEVAFAVRYHSALRFYPDPSVGYEYPDIYRRVFGEDYVPPKYVEETYRMVRRHKWYLASRLVTVNDFYAFDPKAKMSIEPFLDLIGRHFKQPREGLGNDSSPVAHMWRAMVRPDSPL